MPIKIVYFNLRGLAELSRLIAAYGKIEYEDSRVEFSEWPALKASVPYTTLPYMEVDGVQIGQSLAIARYLAKQAGIAGKTDVEQALADGIVDFVKDLLMGMAKARFPSSPEEQATTAREWVSTKAPSFCQIIEKFLEKNGGTYLVGESLTYADIAVAHVFDVAEMPEEKGFQGVTGVEDRFKLLDKFPLLKKHRDMVYNLDGIKEWLKNRPFSPL